MNELFAWVPWFRELARKIAEGGPEYLAPRARTIPWKADGSEANLLKYGDDKIDPFSFFYFLASKNLWDSARQRVHAATLEHFRLTTRADFDTGYYYPTPNSRGMLLFHDGKVGDPDLLWRLFRAAVRGAVRNRQFEDALGMVSEVALPECAPAERDELGAILLRLGERRNGHAPGTGRSGARR